MKYQQSSGGLGICGVVLVIFIVLKLLGVAPVANWSWAVVLIPLWISLGIAVLMVIIVIAAIIIGDR